MHSEADASTLPGLERLLRDASLLGPGILEPVPALICHPGVSVVLGPLEGADL